VKPKTVFCRRAALMRWTGWSEKRIALLVRAKVLKTSPRITPRDRLLYNVSSAQAIIDGKNGAE
jgi:hypothetical protein